MFNKDRLIQAVALTAATGSLALAATMAPGIQERRVQEDLVPVIELSEGTPPEVAVAAVALGSFRGVAANALWYRLEMLKREGQYYEADTVSRLITTLQPRFSQVWVFMAWNMAYNISVQTHTPSERWDWVNKGLRLLREEAIPTNPDSIGLYRYLSWMFFHKVGERTDDMHKYYKYKLALEWDNILGPMYENLSDQSVMRAMERIVYLSELYWRIDRPNFQNRIMIASLLGVLPDDDGRKTIRKLIYDMQETPLERLLPKVDTLHAALQENAVAIQERNTNERFTIDGFIEQLRISIQAQIDGKVDRKLGTDAFVSQFNGQSLYDLPESSRPYLSQFANNQNLLPDVRPVMDRLQEGDIPFNREGLLRVGKVIGVVFRLIPEAGNQFRIWQLPPDDKIEVLQSLGLGQADVPTFNWLMGLVFNQYEPQAGNPNLSAATQNTDKPNLFPVFYQVVMPFWRAKVLTNEYNMDPTTMLLLMHEYGPIDWRNAASHSIYWGQIGMQRTVQMMDTEKIDTINTMRRIIQGLQALERTGKVFLNPYAKNPNDRISFQPNFVFADAYDKAKFSSVELYKTLEEDEQKAGTFSSFDAGHENFLIDVTNQAYVYGNMPFAERYFLKARRLYGTNEDGTTMVRYDKTLDQFVFDELTGDLLQRFDIAKSAITIMIQRAFREAQTQGNDELFDNLLTQAKSWYDRYQDDRADNIKATADTARLAFEPWPEFLQNAYVGLVLDPSITPLLKQRILLTTNPDLVKRVAPRLTEPLQQQIPEIDWRWLSVGSPAAVNQNTFENQGRVRQ